MISFGVGSIFGGSEEIKAAGRVQDLNLSARIFLSNEGCQGKIEHEDKIKLHFVLILW